MITYIDTTGRHAIVVLEHKDLVRGMDDIPVEELEPHHFRVDRDMMTRSDLLMYQRGDGVLKILKSRWGSKGWGNALVRRLPLASMMERILGNPENFPVLMGMDEELDKVMAESLKKRRG